MSSRPSAGVPAGASVYVVTGPTASGKGATAFELARRLGGEIVSLDSMKVYREIDIATAKPPPERRAAVSHHLLDIVDPDVDFSTGEYLPRLAGCLGEIFLSGKPAIVVGGTALYLKAFLEGLQAGPGANWEIRSRLLEEAKAMGGPGALYRKLEEVDPAAARKIHPHDLRRIVRALEVVERTGISITEEWRWRSQSLPPAGVKLFGIEWEREPLYRRIDARVDRMVSLGLFDEARRLSSRSPPLSRTAAQCIGYKEIREGQRLGRSTEDTVRLIQQESRRFAKRQLTWFRRFPIEWIRAEANSDPGHLAGEILARI